MTIPVSVIVVTKNEEKTIERCLAALAGFDEIIIVDSGSTDRTQELAIIDGAQVVEFSWNGQYPKKRQWCLDNLSLKYDWVFFVDADEVVTPELMAEIAALDFTAAGYFVKGRYVMEGRVLRHGLVNNKLALIDRCRMEFPVVDDLDLPGMGEIEGHYQPVLKAGFADARIGQLRAALLHYAYESRAAWQGRHARYAQWERGMNARAGWPEDPVAWRRILKRVFRTLPGRGEVAFMHCFIVKRGFLDGREGLRFAADRFAYYRMIGR